MDPQSVLAQHKIRATSFRVIVLKLLQKAKEPVDVPGLIEELEGKGIEIDRTTVFRVINLFATKGIVQKVEFGEGKFRYELASLPHHYHLICTNCGTVKDVVGQCHVEARQKETAKKFSFLIRNHRVDFFGLCQKCQVYIMS